MPRRGIVVLRKTKLEVIEMIQVWAALEGMAARLISLNASRKEIEQLRKIFEKFHEGHTPADYLSEYSEANIQFHQTLIKMTGSKILQEMTENILLHVRGIRKITIGRDDRASQSIKDHLAIIDALEKRDTELAERLCRDHTLGLAAYVEKHSEGIWTETSWSAHAAAVTTMIVIHCPCEAEKRCDQPSRQHDRDYLCLVGRRCSGPSGGALLLARGESDPHCGWSEPGLLAIAA